MRNLILIILLGTLFFCKKQQDWPELLDFIQASSESRFLFSRPEPDASESRKLRARNKLLNLIHNARESILVWSYTLKEPEIISALVSARDRGVHLRILGSPEQNYIEAGLAGLSIEKRSRSGLMHVKLMIFDESLLFSGTGNFTRSGFFHNHNAFFTLNISQIDAKRIAHTLEHEESPATPLLKIGEGFDMLVSPGQGRLIQSLIIQKILSARRSVRFLSFSHTDPLISRALFWKAKQGLFISGVFDDPSNRGEAPLSSQINILNNKLRESPALLYLEGNRSVYLDQRGDLHGGHLHHKTMIIDEEVVLTGSYNWSKNARDANKEVLFQLYDPLAVQRFLQEFKMIRNRSILLPRPAPSLIRLPPDNFRLYFRSHTFPEICWEGAIPHLGFTVFSGKGNSFRANFFQPQNPGLHGCAQLGTEHKLSAGLAGYKNYLLAPDHKQGHILRYEFDLDLTGQGNYSPEAWKGEPVQVRQLAPLQGRIWLEKDLNGPLQMTLFSGKGKSAVLQLKRLAPGYFTFAPQNVTGDMLLKFTEGNDKHHLACIFSGRKLDGPIQIFLNAYAWDTGQTLKCLRTE